MLLSRKDCVRMDFDKGLQRFLYGKECAVDELPFSEEMIKKHVRCGYIVLRPGIETAEGKLAALLKTPGGHVCRRCGNRDPGEFGVVSCGRCGKPCVYCRHCLNMGVIRSCTRLASWTGPEPEREPAPWGDAARLCRWDGTFSEMQAAAAADLARSLDEGKNYLVWAVCGSGKTEIMFPAIEHGLLHGERIVLATPRTDVVRELAPRLRQAFPEVPVSALYAGSEERLDAAPLVIATTHQLIHYRHYFDRVFIDEVDAFPFSFDPMLKYAAEKSAKDGAPFACLSATPPRELKNAFQSGKLPGTKISRRYHGHPLPEPRNRWIGDWKKRVRKGQLPETFRKWIHEKMVDDKQLFVFAPSVSLVREVTELLQREGIGHVAGVHSEDSDRHEKMKQFRDARIRILVTTTILERGVTVPGVDVSVFGADDPVFDERALVQIAGRVGRSPDCPDGDVVYFHNGRTLEMVRACRHIRRMNEEGGF